MKESVKKTPKNIKKELDKKEKRSFDFSKDAIQKIRKNENFDGKEGRYAAGIYTDTSYDAMGLKLRLSRGGKMTFVVHGRIAKIGRAAQFYTIGDARTIFTPTAREIAGKFRTLMAKGIDPIKAHKYEAKKLTLKMFFEEYLSSRGVKSIYNLSGLQEDTIKEYKKQFDRLSPSFVKQNALKITRDQIKYEHNIIGVNSTAFMADKTMHLVSALFNNARKRHIDENNAEMIKSNPVDILNIDKAWNVNDGQSRRKRECIDTEDMKDVLDGLEALEKYRGDFKNKHKTPQAAIVCSHFFRLLLFTGWRPEDCCDIKWNQVEKNCKEVTWSDIEAVEGLKGAEAQYRFPLNSEAEKVLLSLKKYNYESEFLFPSNKLTTSVGQNPTLYIDLLEELIGNGKRYTLGIFRKTFQTYAHNLDINSTTIKRLVFHTQKVYDVQSGYIATTRTDLRRKSQRVSDLILYFAKRSNSSQTAKIEIKSSFRHIIRRFANEDNISEEQMLEIVLENGIAFTKMKRSK